MPNSARFGGVNKGPHKNSDFPKNHENKGPHWAREARPKKIALFECFTVQKHEKIDSQKVMRIRDPIEFRKFGQVNKRPHANSEF